MFRTEFKSIPAPFLLDHGSTILTIGSCFADVLGRKLTECKFNVSSNPAGILYHPFSIFQLLSGSPRLDEPYFTSREGIWYHHDFHSMLHAPSKEELLIKIEAVRMKMNELIKEANVLVITFGTAIYHELISTGSPIANCHKVPAVFFNKHLTGPQEITEQFNRFYDHILQVNPSIKIILSVSPVRHLKDSLPLNSSSKASLRFACQVIQESRKNIHYFPAYEIMMDDLRDYRFYKSDMIHPSEVAEEYIWDHFQNEFFGVNTRKLVTTWSKILKDINHTPFQEKSEEYRKFLLNLKEKLLEVQLHLMVDNELSWIREKLGE